MATKKPAAKTAAKTTSSPAVAAPKARALGPEEKDECMKIFDIFDRNAENIAPVSDTMDMLTKLGQTYTKRETEAIMKEARGPKGDKKNLGPEEWLVLCSKWVRQDDEEEILRAFKVFDANGDGVIDFDEFKFIMQKVGEEPLTDAEVEEAMKEADEDGNGVIDIPEFMDLIRKSKNALKEI
ncbi:calcium vector protein isoform X2 [Branchiostoma floridae]|uniref:Calcium vector protein isoform X2 n=1 Tax=Branchiostoma floridae TaxID=7739 RepID=A0A9J7KFQ7_BRAFL|nr:calcium vector protein isoform X2 [Branchiostoma floridae]